MVWSIYGLAAYLKGLCHSSGYLIKENGTQTSIDERAELKRDLQVQESKNELYTVGPLGHLQIGTHLTIPLPVLVCNTQEWTSNENGL